MMNQIKKTKKIKDFFPSDKYGERLYGTGKRKTTIAKVYLSKILNPKDDILENNFIVNDTSAHLYFSCSTEIVRNALRPLFVANLDKQYKVVCVVQGGGKQAQSDAVALGIARILYKQDEGVRLLFKQHKLLTRDAREVERKKYGHLKARKEKPFSKR